jgi:N-acetylglutamate synthase-like GNAT family acetyltransferase
MPSPISIEKYSARHKDGVADLIVPIQQDEFKIAITREQQPDLADIENFYQSGCGNFWVALEGGRVVGTISLKDIGGNCVALRKMFVHKDFRGEAQVALRLLQTALAWGAEQRVEQIFLGTTPQFFAAHRFYEKNGFTEITQNKLPASFPVMAVDKKFYQYKLTA